MANREITPLHANKFWEYLEKEHPKIFNQLSNFALINGAIVSFKPARMSDEDFEEYERLLYRWQIDNGFWEEITLMKSDQTSVTFPRNAIIDFVMVNEFTTRIVLHGATGGICEILVPENMKALEKRLYV